MNMNFRDLEKGQHVSLRISDIERSSWGKSYFVFNFDDRPEPIKVGMFKYQESMSFSVGTPVPCYIKEDDKGQMRVTQDFTYVFKQLFKEGEVYDFEVKKDFTDIKPPYYMVSDDNGFQLILGAQGINHLYIGQHIKCMVSKLKNCYIDLKLMEGNEESTQLKALKFNDLMATIFNTDKGRKDQKILKERFLEPLAAGFCREAVEAYKQGHGEWVFMVIEAIKDNLPDILTGCDADTVDKFLHYSRCATLYLLEESGFISNLNDNERKEKQQILAGAVRHIDSFKAASDLIRNGQDTAFVDRLVNNLSQSGYLYEPERVFKTLMYLFRLKPELMDIKMQAIFDVITARPLEMWKTEPFRSAFISQLEFFIDKSRVEVDNLANIDNEGDRVKLDKIATALGILQLLDEDRDAQDTCVYASMLYRYLTLYNTSGQDTLFNLSYYSLIGRVGKTNLTLNDCKQPMLMAYKMSNIGISAGNDDTVMNYVGKNIQMNLSPTQIVIHPVVSSSGRNALPQQLQLWKNIKVVSTENIGGRDISLSELHKQWVNVERSFIADKLSVKVLKPRRRVYLDIGSEVKVYVSGNLSPETYCCHFVDSDYDELYEARLHLTDIVRFKTESDMSCFIDEQTEQPFIYKATVKNIHDGKYKQVVDLDMKPFTDDFNSNRLKYGDEVDCLVLKNNLNNTYICLDDTGLTLILRKVYGCPTDIGAGTMVRVMALGFEGYNQMQAEFVSFSNDDVETITVGDAFYNLMQTVSDETLSAVDETDDEQEDVMQEDSLLSDRRVEELIHIIDRKTVLQSDYKLNFYYLSVAHLVSVMIENASLSEYLDSRLKLLIMLDNFAINHVVDTNELKTVANLKSKIAIQSVLKLKIIASLDDQLSNEMLWTNLNRENSDAEVSSLSRLALAYNLLSDMGFSTQRQAIRNEIDSLLHFNTSKGIEEFGEESEIVEFKTSLVYPPENHMMPNLPKQTETILKVVCAFLNSKGGSLYLGVNDNGIPTGLHNDLVYTQFHESRDAYKVYIGNQINYYMHDTALSRIEMKWLTVNEKDILVVHVQASPIPVTLNNVLYARRGSICVQLNGSDRDIFLRTRAEAFRKEDTAEAQPQTSATIDENHTVAIVKDNQDTHKTYCQTGRQRNNVLFDYEEDYIRPVKYLTLYPYGRYEVSDDQTWPSGTFTQIAIHDDETAGYVVLVYRNGNAVRVPMKDVLEKNSTYPGNDDSELVFASPAGLDNNLLLFLKDEFGNLYYRSESVGKLQEGTMRSKGKAFTAVNSTVCYCEIISQAENVQYARAVNIPTTSIGYHLKHLQGTLSQKIATVLKQASLRYDEDELNYIMK